MLQIDYTGNKVTQRRNIFSVKAIATSFILICISVAAQMPMGGSAARCYNRKCRDTGWRRYSLKIFYYIENQKDYVKFHLEDVKEPVSSLMSMQSLEEKLPDKLYAGTSFFHRQSG